MDDSSGGVPLGTAFLPPPPHEVHQLKEFGDKFISTARINRINRCDLLIVSEDDKRCLGTLMRYSS